MKVFVANLTLLTCLSLYAVCIVAEAPVSIHIKKQTIEHLGKKFELEFGSNRTGDIDIFQVKLSGGLPPETVAHVVYYVGEGVVDHYLTVFSNRVQPPRIITSVNTHSEYRERGYIRYLDMNGDGNEEIIVVGDTSGDDNSAISIYSLKNTVLRDLVRAADSGIDYYIHGDKHKVLFAVSRVRDQWRWYRMAIDEFGLFSTAPLRLNDKVLLSLYTQLVRQKVIHRPHIKLNLLVDEIRRRRLLPNNNASLQRDLERHFHQEKDNWRRGAFVRAMAWPGNRRFLTLLENVPEADMPIDAIQTLVVTEGEAAHGYLLSKLKQHLRASKPNREMVLALVLALEQLRENSGLSLVKKHLKTLSQRHGDFEDLVYWVLGDERLLPKTETYLYQLAIHASSTELRRLACSRLSSRLSGEYQSKLTAIQLGAGLRHFDDKVRACFALLMGYSGKKAYAPMLLRAYAGEKLRWPRRQMIIALGELKTADIIPFYRKWLFQEKDPEFSTMMLWQLQRAGYRFSAREIHKGIALTMPKRSIVHFIKLAAETKTGMKRILELVGQKPETYVMLNAIESLQAFKDKRATGVLRELASQKENAMIQHKAVEALAAMADGKNEAIFLRLLQGGDELVKRAAAKGLAALRTRRGAELLADTMKNQGLMIDGYLEAAIQARSPIVTEVLVDYIVELHGKMKNATLTHSNYHLPIRLCETLRKLDSDACRDYLISWAGPEFPEAMRVEAIEYLEKHGSNAQKKLIDRFVNDPSRAVRRAVTAGQRQSSNIPR